ncbi:MAG: GNAT family N-acetyltransferase [Alphaproteobacteria bacterium]|nr:GNAT family N-acetyltransferase [Alphaproteobacteria bacterium]
MFIRHAIQEDAAGIAKVHVLAWRESYKDIVAKEYLDGLSLKEKTAYWGRLLTMDNGMLHLVACGTKGQIVGFCGAGPIRAKSSVGDTAAGEIYAIYLLDSHKNKGLGTLLWDSAVEYCRTHYLTPCVVWCLKENMPARRFYEKKGGVLSGHHDCVIGDISHDEIRYTFPLDGPINIV